MFNLWKCFIRFQNASDLSPNFLKLLFSAQSSLASLGWLLKGWLLNYCSICTFHQVGSSICSLGAQRKTVSTRWEHGKMDILFLSLIFLSKLLESLFVDIFPITTIWTTSVLFWGAECFIIKCDLISQYW